jgi:hypothetical protein
MRSAVLKSPRGEDYAHQQPSLTRKKLQRLEITAGAPKYTRRAKGIWATNDLMRTAELELARQAETSYKRMVQRPAGRRSGEKSGRERDTGARINLALEGQSRAADSKLLTSALRYVSRSRPTKKLRLHKHSDKTRDSAGCRNTGQNPLNDPPPEDRAHRRRSNALHDHHMTNCTPTKSASTA